MLHSSRSCKVATAYGMDKEVSTSSASIAGYAGTGSSRDKKSCGQEESQLHSACVSGKKGRSKEGYRSPNSTEHEIHFDRKKREKKRKRRRKYVEASEDYSSLQISHKSIDDQTDWLQREKRTVPKENEEGRNIPEKSGESSQHREQRQWENDDRSDRDSKEKRNFNLEACSSYMHDLDAPEDVQDLRSAGSQTNIKTVVLVPRRRDREDAAASSNMLDANLPAVDDDPRPVERQINHGRKGRNTESFDPCSTLVRPDMRVLIGNPGRLLTKRLKHDDIVIVPHFFCPEDDWTMYCIIYMGFI